MDESGWQTWLAEWNQILIETLQTRGRGVQSAADLESVPASSWLGHKGASAQELSALEKTLDITLPPSYRSFLAVSNGFEQPGCFVPRILATNQVAWLKDSAPDSITAWIEGENYGGPPLPISDDKYFVYDENQRTESLRSEHLWQALQISAREEAGTAVYLLNPAVKFPNGEWEAWFWAHWLPGARRYRSFWDMMQEERQSFIELAET